MAKFKKGDRVKIVGHNSGFASGHKGKEFVISNVGSWERKEGDDYFNWGGKNWYSFVGGGEAWDMDLELVKEGKIVTTNTKKEFITKSTGEKKKFPDGMVRDVSDDKVRYDLIYTPMLKRWAELMGRGAKNYGERNWEQAESLEALNRFKESAIRHFMQWFDGETDEDHASAVFFNISGAEMVTKKLNEKRK